MTVEKLIEELMKIEDKSREVAIAIEDYATKNFKVIDEYDEITLE